MFHLRSKKHRNKVISYHKDEEKVAVETQQLAESVEYASAFAIRRSTVDSNTSRDHSDKVGLYSKYSVRARHDDSKLVNQAENRKSLDVSDKNKIRRDKVLQAVHNRRSLISDSLIVSSANQLLSKKIPKEKSHSAHTSPTLRHKLYSKLDVEPNGKVKKQQVDEEHYYCVPSDIRSNKPVENNLRDRAQADTTTDDYQVPRQAIIQPVDDIMRSSGSFGDANAFIRNNGSHDTNTTDAKIRNGSRRHKSHKFESAEDLALLPNKKGSPLSYTHKKLTKALSAKLLLDDDAVKVPTHYPKLKSRPSIRKILLHGVSGRSVTNSSSSSPILTSKKQHSKEDDVADTPPPLDPNIKNMGNDKTNKNTEDSVAATSISSIEDTRHYILQNLLETEINYVAALRTLKQDYYNTLKDPSNNIVINKNLINAIFYQVPEILLCHDFFLDQLARRIETSDNKRRIGDLFLQSFTKVILVNAYSNFIINFSRARKALAVAYSSNEGFQKFLEVCAKEHKEKLTLQDLMIMPVQRIPRYVLVLKELLKYTPLSHHDYDSLKVALRELRKLADSMNEVKVERERHKKEEEKIRDIEILIDGFPHLASPGRHFIRRDNVSELGKGIVRKDRSLILFSDLLVCVVKRRAGTFKRMSSGETFKYRLQWMAPLRDISICQAPSTATVGQNSRILTDKSAIKEIEHDLHIMRQITTLSESLNCNHKELQHCSQKLTEDLAQKLQQAANLLEKHQLAEQKQNTSGLLFTLVELSINFRDGSEATFSFSFESPEAKSSWKYDFADLLKRLESIDDDEERKALPKLDRTWEFPNTDVNEQENLKVIRWANSMIYNITGSSTQDLHKNSAVWMALGNSNRTEIHCLSIKSDQIICNKVIDMKESVTSLACAPFNLNFRSNIHMTEDSNDQFTNDIVKIANLNHAKSVKELQVDSISNRTETIETSITDDNNSLSSLNEPHITVQADKIIVSTIEADCKPSNNFMEITYSNDDNAMKDDLERNTSSELNSSTDETPNAVNAIEADNAKSTTHNQVNAPDSFGNESLKLSQLSKYYTDREPASPQLNTDRESYYGSLDDTTKELFVWLDDMEGRNTLWIALNNGSIRILSCHLKDQKKEVIFQHDAPITAILYTKNRVFLSLTSGNLLVYNLGSGNNDNHDAVKIHLFETPITYMIDALDTIWCSCENNIKVINIETLSIEASIIINVKKDSKIDKMIYYKTGVWVSFSRNSILRLFHAISYERLLVIDTAPDVLSGIDSDGMQSLYDMGNDIQVTSLLVYNDLLWIGTNMGAILNLPLPNITITTSCLEQCPPITLLSCGHYGSVDMLSVIITTSAYDSDTSDAGSGCRFDSPTLSRCSSHGKDDSASYAEGVASVFIVSCGRGCRTFKNSSKQQLDDEKLPKNTKGLSVLFWRVSEFNV
ncbi:Rho guanine nucleotide exchange factor 17 [Trichoplax sp. H2]|nr:Rho guanine nucleotide exchange factor 17 [Trichoplax sp. H2]|eukprot:RDD39721.1 Rho guanine nucleotide exchange factor 17 [Trichoplax sp. H2]